MDLTESKYVERESASSLEEFRHELHYRFNNPVIPFKLKPKSKEQSDGLSKAVRDAVRKEYHEKQNYLFIGEDNLVKILEENRPEITSLFTAKMIDSFNLRNEISLEGAVRIYVHRPDLKYYFSEEAKSAGEAELKRRREALGTHMITSNLVNSDVAGITKEYI